MDYNVSLQPQEQQKALFLLIWLSMVGYIRQLMVFDKDSNLHVSKYSSS